MGAYLIRGGTPLRGAVQICGAKNSVLPILAATLATGSQCVLHNCPAISDVDAAVEILRSLGCRVRRCGGTLAVDTEPACRTEISPQAMKKMRAAVIFLGALVARFGEAQMAQPGGCVLGERPIDLHLRGLRLLGAHCAGQGECVRCTAGRLRGCTIALPIPSVGATENLLLAALGAEGETVLCNAAREPEICDLIRFLRACGAQIRGEGTSVLRVVGKKPLHGAEHTVMPDRIETATFLSMAAATRGELLLCGSCPSDLRAVTEVFARGGCILRETENALCVTCPRWRAVSPIRTAPYPGFPTDAQAPVMAALSTARGDSVMEETIFSDRLRHVPALRRMGADILTTKSCAVIRGVRELHGAEVAATDLRGGAAMVTAALAAHGESRITQTEHIERGYAALAARLRACCAQIEYIEG